MATNHSSFIFVAAIKYLGARSSLIKKGFILAYGLRIFVIEKAW